MNRILPLALAFTTVSSVALAEAPPEAAPPAAPIVPADVPTPAPADAATDASTPALTDAATHDSKPDDTLGLVVGLKLGGAFNGVFNTLGAAFSPELEVGYRLPPLGRLFEVFMGLRYAAPSTEGENPADPRLPADGIAHWRATRNELALGLGLRARLELGNVTPYLAAGARLYLLRTDVSGEVADTPFGQNEETGHAFGFLFALGAEYALGPGRLLAELAINGAPLDETVFSDTNASSLDAYLGYRIFF